MSHFFLAKLQALVVLVFDSDTYIPQLQTKLMFWNPSLNPCCTNGLSENDLPSYNIVEFSYWFQVKDLQNDHIVRFCWFLDHRLTEWPHHEVFLIVYQRLLDLLTSWDLLTDLRSKTFRMASWDLLTGFRSKTCKVTTSWAFPSISDKDLQNDHIVRYAVWFQIKTCRMTTSWGMLSDFRSKTCRMTTSWGMLSDFRSKTCRMTTSWGMLSDFRSKTCRMTTSWGMLSDFRSKTCRMTTSWGLWERASTPQSSVSWQSTARKDRYRYSLLVLHN